MSVDADRPPEAKRASWRRTRAVIALASFGTEARGALALSVLGATLAAGLELAGLYVVYRVAATVLDGSATVGELLVLAALAAGAVVGHRLLLSSAIGLSHLVSFEILLALRLRIADRLARLPLGYFARRPSGQLKKLVVDDVERVELFLAHGIPEMVSGLAVWIGATAWLLVVDWRMALAAVAVVPVAFGMMHIAMRRAERTAPAAQAAEGRMNVSVVDYVTGMPVIRIFNRADDSFRETRHAVAKRTERWNDWSRAYMPLGSPFYSLIVANIVAIVPVGLWLYRADEVSQDTLLLFVVLGIGYCAPLLRFFLQGMMLAHMATSGELVRLLLTEPVLPDSGRTVPLAGRSIEFRDVSFAYDDRPVLSGVSFVAAQGEVTALVGPSGAGKTTVARLVARAWDVQRGAVLLGGVDVRDMAVEQLMREVAVVFQDTFLFDDTIEANIRVGRPDATDAEVQAVARAAGCHDFIAQLPDGYRTIVGEGGVRLSGGERQRITIARAILKDSPVVVLDEATAFTDPECEADIQDALSALVAGRTLLVVAHRLSTIAGADRIVVLDHGRVVDTGTHQELLDRGGLYERMWREHLDARTRPVRGPAESAPVT